MKLLERLTFLTLTSVNTQPHPLTFRQKHIPWESNILIHYQNFKDLFLAGLSKAQSFLQVIIVPTKLFNGLLVMEKVNALIKNSLIFVKRNLTTLKLLQVGYTTLEIDSCLRIKV